MSWTASVISGGSWLSIASGSSGVNSGTISLNYLANTSDSSRTGTIRVMASGANGSPADVTVIQSIGTNDTDNDGTPDEYDAFPTDPTESLDTDGDGVGDNADTDDDNDGRWRRWLFHQQPAKRSLASTNIQGLIRSRSLKTKGYKILFKFNP